MNKNEYAPVISEELGISQRKVCDVIEMYHGLLQEELFKDGYSVVSGFGSYHIRDRKARTYKLAFRDGKEVTIPEHKTVIFKPSRQMSTWLNV